MRSIAFTIFTPFYFIKAGLYVSIPQVGASLGIIVLLLALKVFGKTIGVWPLSRFFKMHRREAAFSTLLMSTGLTFGTISALFGLNNHIIDKLQYTILVSVIILSAVLPTLIAQRFFEPSLDAMDAWGERYHQAHGGSGEVAKIKKGGGA
jgi:Kef-type K+ transport system membrane component KefB